MPGEPTADLSGISAEGRAELAALVAVDDAAAQSPMPESSTDAAGKTLKAGDGEDKGKKATKDAGPPAWFQQFTQGQQAQTDTLTRLLQSIDASTRTLHGEVRKQGAQRQPASSPPVSEGADPFKELEGSDDPQIAALARAFKGLSAKAEQMARVQEVSTMSAAEQAERQNWMAYLEEMAGSAKVSFQDVEPQLRKLATQDLARQGRDVVLAKIARVAASEKTDAEAAEKDAKLLAQQEAIRLLKATSPGLWEVIRGGLADTSSEIDQMDKLNAALRQGRLTPEEHREQTETLKRKLR